MRGGRGLDGGGKDALDADAVAAHDGHDFFAFAIEDGGSHGLRVFVAELEDVADLDGFADLERLAAGDVQVAFVDVADVGDARPGEVAAWRDVAEVVVEFVGSADHIFAAFESLVDDDERGARIAFVCGKDFEADGAEVASWAFEVESEFFGDHGAEFGYVGGGHQLGLVDEVVAAQEGDNRDLDGFAGAILLACPCRRRS